MHDPEEKPIEIYEINEYEAVNYIFHELIKEGKPASEEDIRLVLQLFYEYIARVYPEIDVDLE